MLKEIRKLESILFNNESHLCLGAGIASAIEQLIMFKSTHREIKGTLVLLGSYNSFDIYLDTEARFDYMYATNLSNEIVHSFVGKIDLMKLL